MPSVRLFALSCACLLAVGSAGAQSATAPQSPATPEPRSVTAVRLADDEGIVLDGVLDEAIWARTPPATNFIQQDPANGQPATEQTEVRIAFNSRSLYMGVTCHDSEPDRWIGYQRRRDEFLPADDRFMWNIDTFNNQQSAYFFEMNPSGLMGDALRGAGFTNRQWDGIWYAKVRRSEIGWTLEIEIPFSTLNFDPAATAWGINFQRTVRRKNEESVWMGWARNQGLNRLANAGRLIGLERLSQGRGLDIKPYVIGTLESFPGRGRPEIVDDAGVGADVFYSPTPGLRTNLTINTDFAQTEVDQRLVNLTRFPLFFPERRDFFLDGSTFFDFQSTNLGNNTLLPYFTRRIGLNANGNPQSIDVGGKLAWQYKRNDIGALYVRTGREDSGTGGAPGIPGEDFAVLRAKRRMFRQSYVGVLYTGRSPRGAAGPALHTYGVDFQLATATFRGSQNLSAGGFLVDTTNPAGTGKSKAFGLLVEYPNDPWSANVLYREIEANYNAAVGFTPRTGYRRLAPNLQYTVRPRQHPWIRNIVFGVDTAWQMDTEENRLLNRDITATLIQVNTNGQDTFGIQIAPSYERLERGFPISPGITLPRGADYSWNRYRFLASTAQRRTVAVAPVYEVGGFYDGRRRRLATDVNLRLRPGLIIYTSAEWNRVELAAGSFTTRLYRVVPELQFNPWIAWVNNIQYDSQSAVIGWQSRFRWILKPGTDL